MIVLLMGVAGIGKTTVGRALAERLGWAFVDADAFHAPESVAKMAAGEALSEAERGPWLAKLASVVAEARREGRPMVLACSALRREHRRLLMDGSAGDVLLVYLHTDREALLRRLERRRHFFPAVLIESQLATLEPPEPEERALVLDAALPLDAVVERIVAEVAAREE